MAALLRGRDEITNGEDTLDSRMIQERIDWIEGGVLCVNCQKTITWAPNREPAAWEDAEWDGDADTEDAAITCYESVEMGAKGCHIPDSDGEELVGLLALKEEAEQVAGDRWDDGIGFIRDSYFEDYAREFADDIGAVDASASWPNDCIDWERAASELQQDYSQVDFAGVTYWVRS